MVAAGRVHNFFLVLKNLLSNETVKKKSNAIVNNTYTRAYIVTYDACGL